jgi:hypothetical protein
MPITRRSGEFTASAQIPLYQPDPNLRDAQAELK